ncbi:hypothetical protein SAMN04488121_11558 [Chitinophaga filiformis]|uniref:Uncharacterized protein n=1 Tax=Chitinophaga filiformis TaxID=104663 RepID=A0A1G8DPJ6_CHIFI|nr:hypothetical protein SAMN04488121_11558 [Chitinophaga filiformis]
MGHIWLIYGLYMGYLTEQAMVKALQGLFKIVILLIVGNKDSPY